MDIVVRSAVIFLIIGVLIRISGKRQIAQLSAFDLILLVTVGDLIAQAVVQEDYSLMAGILAVTTFTLLSALMGWIAFRFPGTRPLLEGRPRLIVSRTMSKAFAFAGARVGYLAADPAVIDALRLVRLPYHLSALTQAAALGALAHADEMLAMVDEIRAQRDRISVELARLGFHPYRSASNFVLFGGVDEPHAVFEALLERGILIRDIGLPGCLRVTAGTEAETTAFLEALAVVAQAAANRIAT